LGPLLPDWQRFGTGRDPSAPAPVPLAMARHRLFERLMLVFERLFEASRAVFVIDDLDRVDTLTLEWLRWLVRYPRPFKILVLSQTPFEGIRSQYTLSGLDRAHADELICSMLAQPEVPAGLSLAAPTQTPPLPRALVERVRVFAALGVIQRSAAAPWRWAPDVNVDLHDDLDAALIALLAHVRTTLSKMAQAMLMLTATLGQRVSTSLLGPCFERWQDAQPADSALAINDLVREQILEVTGPTTLTFTHPTLRQAVLDQATKDPALHLAIAAVLSARRGLEPVDSATCARHWSEAGEAEEAAVFFQRAAQEMLDQHDPAAAVDLLDEALTHTQGLARQYDLHTQRVEVAQRLGDADGAWSHAEHARDLADQLDDDHRRGRA